MTAGRTPYLEIRGISKAFGDVRVLESFTLDVAQGEFVTLLGPSGCGKTTLLRIIAGLTRPDAGSVVVGGSDWSRLPPHKRRVGIVFQSYALFPHLNVGDNVAFGLKAQRKDTATIRRDVLEALRLVQLDNHAERSVATLSGGQQQRVALARAIITKPDVMLFDEPFSALDRGLRESMQLEMRQLLRNLATTSIFVTHDQQEALLMSDRIVVMNKGHVEQIAPPKVLYANPSTPFVLGFVGQAIRLAGKVESESDGMIAVSTSFGRIRAPGRFLPGQEVIVAARPEGVELKLGGPEHNCIEGVIRDVVYQGSKSMVICDSSPKDHVIAETGELDVQRFAIGERVAMRWDVARTLVYAT